MPAMGKARIKVYRFPVGHSQGEMIHVETIVRTVYTTTAYVPRTVLCSALPIKPLTYQWVEYQGERYRVGPNTLNPETGEFRLCLSGI